jgi:hypothetical protein
MWFGARWRAVTFGRNWSMGPALRLMLPPTADSPPARIETGWAIAGQFRRVSLISDLGLRVSSAAESGSGGKCSDLAPCQQLFLIGGLVYDLSSILRGFVQLDTQLLQRTGDPVYGRMGLGLAAETRGSLYAGWGLRLSPWQDSGGHLAVQLALGLRQ